MYNLYQTQNITDRRLRKHPAKKRNYFSFLTKKEKGIWESYGAINSLTEIFRQRTN